MQNEKSNEMKNVDSYQLAKQFFHDVIDLMPTNAVIDQFIVENLIDPMTASQWKIYNQDNANDVVHPCYNQSFLIDNREKIIVYFSKFVRLLDRIGIHTELQRRNLQERQHIIQSTQSTGMKNVVLILFIYLFTLIVLLFDLIFCTVNWI